MPYDPSPPQCRSTELAEPHMSPLALSCLCGSARVIKDGPACTGSGAAQLEEEVESLKRQLAAAREGEERQRGEVRVSRSQTDSAVAQLRGMQERLDTLEVRPAPLTRRNTP